MKSVLFIMNPAAGLKKANRHLFEILKIFSENDYLPQIVFTKTKGDGQHLVQKYSKNCSLVVISGGDGTFNEVVNGMLKNNIRLPIGYIPAGSTNDFGTTAGLSKNVIQAAKDIASGCAKSLDVGIFNNRYFTYVASFGAFTRVSYSTPQNIKNTFGHLAYIFEGIKDLPLLKSEYMKIKTDNEEFEGEYVFGAITNAITVGGILNLDPEIVRLNDGYLELLLVKTPKNGFELNQIIQGLRSNVQECSMIHFSSCKAIDIICPNAPNWTIDGEFMQGSDTIHIENIKNGIDVIINNKE